MSYLITALITLLAGYIAICAFVFIGQSRYLYYPDPDIGLTPSYYNLCHENVFLKTDDEENIHGWFVHSTNNSNVKTLTRPDTSNTVTVLFCHGNAGNIGDRVYSIKTFCDLGLDVFIFDYRGYGRSSGTASEQGTYRDAWAAWRYLVDEKGISPDRILIFGRSLGGAVAAWLAEKVNPGMLVLESTFTSVPDMARHMFPFLPSKFLCRFKYNTIDVIAKIRCPVIIAHSQDDEMIPIQHGKRLFERAAQPKKLVLMNGTHNSGGIDADSSYKSILAGYISRYFDVSCK